MEVSSVQQYDSCGLPGQERWHTVRVSARVSGNHTDPGLSSQNPAQIQLPAWSNKHAGRRTVPPQVPSRVETGPIGDAEDIMFASNRSKQVRQYFSTDRHDRQSLGTALLYHSWSFTVELLYTSSPDFTPLVLGRAHHLSSLFILTKTWWLRATWLAALIRLSVRLPKRHDLGPDN